MQNNINEYEGILEMVCFVKSKEVAYQLCSWHYPFCTSCKKHYMKWLRDEPEVRKLECRTLEDLLKEQHNDK